MNQKLKDILSDMHEEFGVDQVVRYPKQDREFYEYSVLPDTINTAKVIRILQKNLNGEKHEK
jgi:hypothetical protein